MHLIVPNQRSEYMSFMKRAASKESRRNAQAEIEAQMFDILNEEALDLEDAWDLEEMDRLERQKDERWEFWERVREMEEKYPGWDWYAEVDDGYAKYMERKWEAENLS